ncbi:hypothetical protein C8R47DRAFT_1313230 [Mycena vitilis]|nr:hypothetical protein C8R47DRAFT_1313230 [Mycena vitilis]
MGKSKSAKKNRARAELLDHLSSSESLQLLRTLDIGDSFEVDRFRDGLSSFLEDLPCAEENFLALIHHLMSIVGTGSPQLHGALSSLHTRIKGASVTRTAASHQAKRTLIYRLGLREPPRSLADFCNGNPFDSTAPLGTLMNPRIIWREHDFAFGPRLRTVLADTKCRPYASDFVCDEAAGFHICDPSESVLFLAHDASKTPPAVVQLVVLREVFGDGLEESSVFLAWLKDVVDLAVSERRDVRPDTPGKMIQLGFNAGPRHAHVFGLAKSFTANLDSMTMADHDEGIIAATTLVWGAAKAWLPTDITSSIDDKLSASGMPRIATRNVAEGTGFHLNLAGTEYSFPMVERAPPEAYMTIDYSAHDPCYVQGASAISVNVGRTLDPLIPTSPLHRPDDVLYSSRPSTRSQTRPGEGPVTLDPLTEDPNLWPAGGGGNFVDMSLKVVVKQAAGTLFAFDPTFRHGTTRLCGAHNHTVTIAFSARIHDAFEQARQGISIDAGSGAGDGNVP